MAQIASLNERVLGCDCRGPKTRTPPVTGDVLVDLSGLAVVGERDS